MKDFFVENFKDNQKMYPDMNMEWIEKDFEAIHKIYQEEPLSVTEGKI